jgi:hypothetical protein
VCLKDCCDENVWVVFHFLTLALLDYKEFSQQQGCILALSHPAKFQQTIASSTQIVKAETRMMIED